MILAGIPEPAPFTRAEQRDYWRELVDCLNQLEAVVDLAADHPELFDPNTPFPDQSRTSLQLLASAVLLAKSTSVDRLQQLGGFR